MSFKRLSTYSLFVLLLLLSLTKPIATVQSVEKQIKQRLTGSLYSFSPKIAGGEYLTSPEYVSFFYNQRSFSPAWSDENGPRIQTEKLISTIRESQRDGLNPDRYHLDQIPLITQMLKLHPDNQALRVELDLLLSDAFFTLFDNMDHGLCDPAVYDMGHKHKSYNTNVFDKLETSLISGRIQEEWENLLPNYSDYYRLKEFRNSLKNIVNNGGWPKIPNSKILKPGQRSSLVRILRKRLVISGNLASEKDNYSSLYDLSLVEAVKKFQRQHGLRSDGILGFETITELNVSAEKRLELIDLNLEKWRWLPKDPGEEYILVNIPEGRLKLYQEGSLQKSFKVVVGKTSKKTAIFSDTMSYVVINPSWKIPKSIVLEKMLPRAKADSLFFIKRNIEVFYSGNYGINGLSSDKIEWDKYSESYLPFRFCQPPGPLNAMGRIKFMFPNPYKIYIHDTPSRYLFKRSRITYSSGCIRVQKPLELAEMILNNNCNYSSAELHNILRNRDNETLISLERHVPVHIVYFTCVVDKNGECNYLSDIYNWDEELLPNLTYELKRIY